MLHYFSAVDLPAPVNFVQGPLALVNVYLHLEVYLGTSG